MSPRPRGGGRTARRGVLIAALAFAVGLPVVAPQLAASASVPQATSAPTVVAPADSIKVQVASLDPKSVTPSSTVIVAGSITNTGTVPLTGVQVTLRSSSQPIRTRYQLAQDTDPTLVLGSTVAGVVDAIGVIEPGASAPWRLEVAASRLHLGAFGVYPIAVEARASVSGQRITARIPTFLPWVPATHEFTPTRIAWLWPLADDVRREVDGTFVDDHLTEALAPDGRLGDLLAAATAAAEQLTDRRSVPVAWVVDPDLLEAVDAMTAPDGYRVQTPRHQIVDGTGKSVAQTWLDRLRTAVSSTADSEIVPLPYADPDLVALHRAGYSNEINAALTAGRLVTGQVLGAEPISQVAWPPDGYIDAPTLNTLAGAGIDTVVLGEDALPPINPNTIAGVRAGIATSAGQVNAVLTDRVLTATLAAAGTTLGGPRIAEQRFLAETAMITAQFPGRGSTVVVAPPREWAPPTGFAAAVLSDTATAPWLDPVQLADVIAQPADATPRLGLTYPEHARAAELPASSLSDLGTLVHDLSLFGAIIAGPASPWLLQAQAAVLRSTSTTLRDDPAGAARLRASVRTQLDVLLQGVRITPVGLITMTSRRQKIPVTVANNLDQAVTVRVRLQPLNAARLTVTQPDPVVTIEPQHKYTVEIAVEATISGQFRAEAWLETVQDVPQPYGARVPVELNSTAYGAVALAITGGAFAVLLVAVGVRLTRRVVRARRTPTEPKT